MIRWLASTTGVPDHDVKIGLLPAISAGVVRRETYALFARGLAQPAAATRRSDLLGPSSAETVAALPVAMEQLRRS